MLHITLPILHYRASAIMDAHSVSFTSVAQRSTSRIWQDLKTCRPHISLTGLQSRPLMSGRQSPRLSLCKRRAAIADRKPHIGIIGAGLAGLRCADVLLQQGFHVTIIEGRNRLGGRVHQVRMPAGYLVDAGPNWIHGTSDNPILDIAKQTATPVGTWDSNTYLFDDKGDAVPLAEAEIYSTMMWDIIEAAFLHSNKNCANITPDESLWDFFQLEVARRLPESEADSLRKRDLVFQIAESWGAFVGSHIFGQSLKYFWLEECIEGENLFCAGTYEKILAAIAAPAQAQADMRLNTVLTKVHCTGDTSGSVVVETDKGSFEFDEVVCTMPLGWLKRNAVHAFHPPLPQSIIHGIENIGYGCLEKVYISFRSAFWTKSDDTQNTVKGFCQWLRPDYAPGTNPKRWNQETVELACLAPEASHPTLLFYIYGDQSRYLTSEVAKFSTEDKKAAFLYEWFRPYYSRLPQYSSESADCDPTGYFATNWLADDLAGNGSYSNFQVGLEHGDRDIEAMRKGCPERGLWLAGEHTAPFVALGTATGAYWSGESVGKRIADAYGRGVGVHGQAAAPA
ncbi:flavin-containing amine oxidoreductase [Microdochium trichocladiopsis]|uniref:Flavin-containing amine oxidoreductase n=1 Tax=Microdochium trichocladiopsis TaxID=1682393 RepID=A0A9P8Y0F9_9PEZI|nr:flavin-containing amine oxidoreductase [Microdochium trichocladiopsis]KAH7026240.1 flavin-containing amine oxidoreductase [Microdochium trichocladiopsis]